MVAVPSYRYEIASGDFIIGSSDSSLTDGAEVDVPVRGRMLKTFFV
jgi:hypothetical protein